jgi:hypothetical protein
VVALTYRATVDVPARFRKSKSVGAVFGLTCGHTATSCWDCYVPMTDIDRLTRLPHQHVPVVVPGFSLRAP